MQTSGLDHITVTVSDLERSRKFYAEVLEWEIHSLPRDYPNPIFAGAFFAILGGVEIFFIQHPKTPPGDRFSEFRVGLDHLSFRAPDEAALHALVDRLRQFGIATNGVETFYPAGKQYVSFRDPDNIQLEYWLN